MKTIYIIYAALAAAALANGPFECSFLGFAEIHQCFGAVGQPLIFYLYNKTNVDIRLIKDGKHRILKTDTNSKVTVDGEHVKDSEIMDNGAYIISKASKRHTGEYMLEEFKSNGQIFKTVYVHVKIQAPVSKPAVSQTCLSYERMEITCSTEGDEADFILTVDDRLVIQTRDHAQSLINCNAEECKKSNVSTIVHGQLAGKFTCQVWNNVSKAETEIHLTPCKGVDAITVAVIASVAILSLFAGASLVLIKFSKKSRSTAVNQGDGEIIYSAVTVVRST